MVGSTSAQHLAREPSAAADLPSPRAFDDEALTRTSVRARLVYWVTIVVSALAASAIALMLKASLEGFVWCCRERHIIESTAFLALAIMALILAALLVALIPSMIVSFAAALVMTIVPSQWLRHRGHLHKSEVVDHGYRLAREVSISAVKQTISWGTCLAVFVSGTAIAVAIESMILH